LSHGILKIPWDNYSPMGFFLSHGTTNIPWDYNNPMGPKKIPWDLTKIPWDNGKSHGILPCPMGY